MLVLLKGKKPPPLSPALAIPVLGISDALPLNDPKDPVVVVIIPIIWGW